MRRLKRIACRGAALLLLGIFLPAGTLSAQQIERVVTTFGQIGSRIRPAQIALSPSGSKIAITDQQQGRIGVLGTDGVELWIAGQAAPLLRPTAVCFIDEESVIFSQEGRLQILRVNSDAPDQIDTVADLSAQPGVADLKGIDRILRTSDGDLLVLDRLQGRMLLFDSTWKLKRVFARHGQGKGKLWKPNDMALSFSGKVIVADAGNFPVQVFAPEGQVLFSGSWNSPDKLRSWEAGAVAVDLRETIWVADLTRSAWRLLDATGSQTSEIAFETPLFRPISAVATSDNRLIIADQQGAVVFLTLW